MSFLRYQHELDEIVAQMLIRRKRKDQGDSEDTLFSELSKTYWGPIRVLH